MAAAQTELSMDEILASIRRIIHEEEEPKAKAPRDETNTVDLKTAAAEVKTEAAPKATIPAIEDEDDEPFIPAVPREPKATKPNAKPATTAGPEPKVQAVEAAPQTDNDEEFAAFDAAPLKELLSELPAEEVRAERSAPAEAEASKTEERRPAVAPEVKAETPSPKIEMPREPKAEGAASAEELEPTLETNEALTDRVVESLLGGHQADGVAAAFASLKRQIQISQSPQPKTLEDLVLDMLKPMLQQWLDQNLQPIVEAEVKAEVKRLSGRS